MTASKNSETAVRRPSVRPGARGYANFIRETVAGIFDVDSLSFEEIVELTFANPSLGLGIDAYRATPGYRAEKENAKAAREAELAAKRSEAEAKKRERLEKKKAELAEALRKLGAE